MTDRQTTNVSLPREQDEFLRTQVEAGRYRTVSEAVRDGVRMLQEAEHRRLLEKWMYEGLTKQEEARIPLALRRKFKAHFQKLVAEGRESATHDGVVSREAAIKRLKVAARGRQPRTSR